MPCCLARRDSPRGAARGAPAEWHKRFNARAVVFGHLHIRGTSWVDGVPFQEVSLGYPSQWDRDRGIGDYLREVTLAPAGGSRS